MSEVKAAETVNLAFGPTERAALQALLNSVQANRRVLPLLRQLAASTEGDIVIARELAEDLSRSVSAVLDNGVTGQFLLPLSSVEDTLTAAIGPVAPLPAAPAANRKQRRALKKVAK